MRIPALLKRIPWSVAPPDASPQQRRNFILIQIDGAGVGLANAVGPFLPVFLARLGASNFQVGLLTALPGVTGLLMSLAVGRFLQRQPNIVPWYSLSRFAFVLSYGLIGLVAMLAPTGLVVPAILALVAAGTLPQIVLNVCFSVVMNGIAGPEGRYELMSRRWSILGLTYALAVALAGQLLVRFAFPGNFEALFMALSVGGLVSLYFSSKVVLPDQTPPRRSPQLGWRERLQGLRGALQTEKRFVAFVSRRFIFVSGVALAAPILPLYFVRVAQASDAQIGLISTAQTITVLLGYRLWTGVSKARGPRRVLLLTTLGMAIYPALVAASGNIALIIALAALSGLFQAGLDLVFFDELMRTVPEDRTAQFVAVAQFAQYMCSVAGPILGTVAADHIGLGGALLVSAGLRLIAVLLFARGRA